MKKKSLFLPGCVSFILLSVLCLEISGQETRDFTVGAGESVTDVLSMKEIFLYPEFINGTALNKNGTSSEALFNYNIINGEIQFISPRKDTLAVAKPGAVNFFSIASDTFYYSNGYYRKIAGDKNFMLAAMQYTRLADVRKAGPYGTTTSTGSVDNYSSLISSTTGGVYKLRVNVETVFTMRCDYFFSNPQDKFVPAKKSNLLKMFPDQEEKIKKYLKDESIRFNNKEDLVKLTNFLRQR